ncbi:MAG: hypothetical protein Q8N81_01450, partial [bacterium]|nr:hypothetical protein [bacterium]
MDFPICKTKIEGAPERFDLNDLESRRKYFQLKIGKEIEQLRHYFRKDKSFVAYLLGKKNSGKGTYSKMFMEIIGGNHVGHVAVGDIVREVHKDLESEEGKRALMTFLRKKYRGFHTVEETVEQLLGRS